MPSAIFGFRDKPVNTMMCVSGVAKKSRVFNALLKHSSDKKGGSNKTTSNDFAKLVGKFCGSLTS